LSVIDKPGFIAGEKSYIFSKKKANEIQLLPSINMLFEQLLQNYNVYFLIQMNRT
jgi:hypothetical protein